MTERDHWAEDNDLLEDFVLDRIAPTLREEMSEHLAGCSSCRELVEAEMILAAGIRKAGAAQTKEHIRAMISGKDIETPWPHILSIAAALVLIIGIGIYNRWFFRTSPIAPSQEVGEVKEGITENTDPAGQLDKLGRTDTGDVTAEQAGTPTGEGAQDEPGDRRMADSAPRPVGLDYTESIYALSGYVLAEDAGAVAKLQSEAESSRDEAGPGLRQKNRSLAPESIQPSGNLVIHIERRDKQTPDDDSEVVPCSLVERDGAYHLTLHLTRQFPIEDKATPQAELASPDSLLVHLSGATIGIKLPARFSGVVKP